MTPGGWQRVEQHLLAVLELPPAERPRYLREAYAADGDLREPLETLLALEQHVEGFLETPPHLTAFDPEPSTGKELETGQRIGPCRILRVLGRGGMSTVYLAQREDDPPGHRVALKVIQRGMGSAEMVRRFLAERRILAQLHHPNIAKVLDGGATEDGLPFFVMEHINGLSIDDYCDSRRLSIEDRLGLFRQVCAAVRYAHQNLVVHRDIKPSNILVTHDGVPKLLDFGIAKLLGPESPAASADATITWLRLMTPNYASPEQMRGQAITTASDVYSLGVLLYKLLTGRLPRRFAGSLPQEIDQVLRQARLTKPSRAVAELAQGAAGDRGEAIARARGTTPARLHRTLRGDLDNIVLMALRVEPERRYGSVEQLAEDLRRRRAGLPVAAREDTLGYRAKKFLGRHKLAVTAVAALVQLALGIAVMATLQSARIEQERRQTDRVSEFLIALFDTSAVGAARSDSITARELLERGIERLHNGLEVQPSVRATLLDTIGQAFNNLQLFDRAEEQFREALAVRRRELGAEHPQTTATLHRLGVALRGAGKYDASEEAFTRALGLRRQRDPRSTEVADTLSGLAALARDQGDFPGAVRLGRQALEIRREKLGDSAPETAQSKALLAFLLFELDEYGEAGQLYEEAISVLRQAPDAEIELAKALARLGFLLVQIGDPSAAEPLAHEALEIRRTILGEQHPVFAESLSLLAFLSQELGDLETAESWQRQNLDVLRGHFAADHPLIARGEYNLALILSERGSYAEAEQLFYELLAMARRTIDERHPRYLLAQVDLAWVLHARGASEQAEALYRQALASLQEGALGEQHQFVAVARLGLASLLSDGGEASEITRRAGAHLARLEAD